jgi:two-component system, cell cycle sensor histidine kinase and response regulator CckA
VAKDILEGLDYTVLVAKNGEEALEIYEENQDQIDLLLFDIIMPRMGGVEASERIRALGGKMPLIFMTGYNFETIQNRFVNQRQLIENLGAIVIQKPYSVQTLGRKVREILDGVKKNGRS